VQDGFTYGSTLRGLTGGMADLLQAEIGRENDGTAASIRGVRVQN
jgi:hypothetical protein